MLLPLLMNLAMFGSGVTPPPTVATPEVPSGGYFGREPSRREREEQIRRDRIKFGVIPDDVPVKAVSIIEKAVARQLDELEYEQSAQEAMLRELFQRERQRWDDAYLGYYRIYLDLLMTQEMKRILQKQRKRKLMIFALMNS